MNYNGREFNHFSITTELQQGIVCYLETGDIRECVSDSIQRVIDSVKENYKIDFKWDVEVEDRSVVYLTVYDCRDVSLISILLKEVAEPFNQSGLFIYFDTDNDDELDECITDTEEGFSFEFLSN